MAAGNREKFDNPIVEWVDSRLPIFTMMQKEYGSFPTPRNFNYFWSFGGMAMLVLVTMILTGVVLAMNYVPHADLAFDSVERITRDVNYGWLLRSIHMNGASMFFIVVYIHMFRALYYGSYKQPRELLWILGVIIFLLMMATAFMGYVLPWSQMSGWGATVITSLFSAFPLVGDGIVTWLWGGFSVDNPTLNRFFALHFLMPFVIVGVVFLHVWALHITGSNNPLGIDVKSDKDTIPFHPYYTIKDSVGICVFLVFFAIIVFYFPDIFVHADHYNEFNPMVTPPQIVPEWYFLPFYGILRAFTYDISLLGVVLLPAKLQGVLAMFGSIVILFFLPWIDRSPIRSSRFRPLYKIGLAVFVVSFFVLGYVGAKHAEEPYITIGQIATLVYFAFFAAIPLINKFEKVKPMPKSISEAILKK